MQKAPPGWPRISPSIYYDDPAGAIDWLTRVFGFTTRLRVDGEGGTVVHSELEFGDGLIMVGATARGEHRKSPRSLGGANTQGLMVFVDDIEAHCAHSRSAGAKIIVAPETHDYGDDYWADRLYEAEDCEGHRWWFAQRMRGPS